MSRPDPIGVDASHLLEGNSLAESLDSSGMSLGIINASSSISTCTPKQPPGSVVGGFGFPNLKAIWTASSSPGVCIIQSVELTVLQRGFQCYLRFLAVNRPLGLDQFITEAEWKTLRERVDEIGKRIRWDVNRSLVLLVILFIMVVIVNTADDIREGFSLGDGQQSLLVFLGVILLKLLWDECWENYTWRSVLHEMDEVCRQYSDIMRPRGACVAFRFVDNDDYGLLVDLIFYRVQTREDTIVSIP